MADRLVEILPGDDSGEGARVADEHSALPVPLAEDHRVRDRVVGRDEASRAPT